MNNENIVHFVDREYILTHMFFPAAFDDCWMKMITHCYNIGFISAFKENICQ